MTPPESVFANFVIQNASNVLVAVLGYFLVRAINRLDGTLDRVADRLEGHERRIATLEGARAERLAWPYQTPKSIVLFLALGVLACAPARAQTPTPATFFPLPANNASFFTTLRTFLLGEDPTQDATWQSDYKITDYDGCRHATAAGTTGTFTETCRVLIDGALVTDPAPSINYATLGATATDFCWVIVTPLVNSTEAGWTRLAGTHYMGNCTAASSARPALTGAGIYVMGTTLTAGAITAVIDLTALSATINTYTNTSEVTGRADLIWRGPTDGSSPQVYCFSDDLGSCNVIPTGNASGCATCGDSASSFFASGSIEAARGGTGGSSAAQTGVPLVTAGTWTYPTRVSAVRGGTGLDTSASTGALRVNAGTWSAQPFPDYRAVTTAADWSTDGTHCLFDSTGVFATTSVPAASATCADNASAQLGGTFWLPGAYDPNTALVFTMDAVNNGTDAGVLGFDFTCLCAGTNETVTAANFASNVNLDMTFSGVQGQQLSTTLAGLSITCGGTCAVGDTVFWRATIDTAATTLATPANIKLINLQLEADQTALGN